MSPLWSNALVVVGLIGICAVLVWQIRRAKRHDAARDRILRESCKDTRHVGPHDPRLPAGINAHLDDYAALDPDLAPVFAPGPGRLWQAIRDEQQNGDQQ